VDGTAVLGVSEARPTRVLIVDDEPPSVERLTALVGEFPECRVVGCESRASRVLERCDVLRPDVVLLDIEMPGIDGLEVARQLDARDAAPAVIFVTAHDEYALEAFGVAAVDYVVKPVRASRLRRALARAAGSDASGSGSLAVHLGGRLIRLPLTEVRAFTVVDKATIVHAVRGPGLIEDSLKSLEKRFGNRFVRVHRNALASKRHLRALYRRPDGSEMVQVDGLDDGLEVSRRNRAAVKELLTSGA
jgi:two-component system response regulator AlgR